MGNGASRAEPTSDRLALERWYAAAIAGAQPGPAVAAAVASCRLPPPPNGVHLLAVGKAAFGMARAAVDALAARGVAPTGGLIASHHRGLPPTPAIGVVAGDHPIPGPASARAAEALSDAAARVGPLDLAVVLLSGGASSLVGAPVLAGLVTQEDVAATSRTLLAAGVPIDIVNAARKRVSRWGAGRLARALTPARVLCLAVSDVPDDDPRVIGSGPCAPDPWTAAALRAALAARGVWPSLPRAVRTYVELSIDLADAGAAAETPKPGDVAFAAVRTQVVRTNADARSAAADAARAAGYAVAVHDAWLAGEAATLGRSLGAAMLAASPGTAHVWGGEPSVTLGASRDARGGRLQELALAVAGALHEAGSAATGVTLLAAGTDGRDGPTDAAGAVVDGHTWTVICAAGRDPAADLAAHRSYDALGAAGALLPAAPSGTNVADVIVALRRR